METGGPDLGGFDIYVARIIYLFYVELVFWIVKD